MKKQAARTMTILGLFIALSGSASKLSAFPTCPTCKPPVQYAASVTVQTIDPTIVKSPAPREALTDAQPESSDVFIAFFWARLLTNLASLV